MLFSKKNKNDSLIKEEEPTINKWLEEEAEEEEGQLAIDVLHDLKRIIIKSTIAGANPENLKISLHNDLLIIKGSRENKELSSDCEYLFKECYWGPFSRSIILPAEVDPKKIKAEIENGVLTITLYKSKPEKIKVTVKD
ncbi:MAG: Hsp20/alpha crystallin family protein [Patescibacteria group bacterium]|nr:Hsp20/alpha crystallin family protein [Patescibacteria group bacterium]MDD3777773.1 Hsp20/alpha crystallin family protein [Patescibacteria group bacterium]MDD3939457.1 Hsp20/alpha crystallin family protein [Patescibacteria group bacterium]MDD4443520.1 Hsp20/alpha crystallin family protein [Patescibacteria group bacterium]NCU39494.1 Hsp20/alpha crystallin family protein [Candidatus Falkowbacteria bacterium]